MLILGLHFCDKLETGHHRYSWDGHDTSAVLLRDGEIVAGIEEERLSRVKHCNFFPKRAIDFCLKEGGISIGEVDRIAVDCTEYDAYLTSLRYAYNNVSSVPKLGAQQLSENFQIYYQQDVSDKLAYCNHHLAHAWSAFAYSGFKDSLVVVFDGKGSSGVVDGGLLSGIIGVVENGKFEVVRNMNHLKSLGDFYTRTIKFIGYDRFDEYKVMGLAPYGDATRFRDIVSLLYRLHDNGEYEIVADPSQILWSKLSRMEGFQPPRRKGQPITQAHKDFAAAIQEATEVIALHVISAAQKEYKKDYLCFAGGVAHNCTLNGKIEESGLFKNVFVQPAAHDAGGALGAAIYAQSLNDTYKPTRLSHLYFGSPIPSTDQVARELSQWQPAIHFEKSENICRDAAELIANDAVIGWVQGRSEFGPRALGNRSILADPRLAENKSRINKMIKKREGYRPFAPSVIEERATEFFDIDPNSRSLHFMNLVVSVRAEKRGCLGAITHVDGTARIQVVKSDANPVYWNLINEFGKITGVPVLLNTSFNNNVEPIVDSVYDAVVCYLTTELTHLIIGDYIISKKEPVHTCIPNFYIGIKESRKLASGYKAVNGGFDKTYTIESNMSGFFARPSTELSSDLFQILNLNHKGRISDIAKVSKIDLDQQLIDEIFSLWSDRAIFLSPTPVN